MISPLDECERRCLGCGRVYCVEVEVSPGEADGLGLCCWDEEDPEAVA